MIKVLNDILPALKGGVSLRRMTYKSSIHPWAKAHGFLEIFYKYNCYNFYNCYNTYWGIYSKLKTKGPISLSLLYKNSMLANQNVKSDILI